MPKEDERPPDPTLRDPEEYSQTKRIQEILNRRRETLDIRNQARREWAFGEINEAAALDVYRHEVETLIIDLWSKLRVDADSEIAETATEYLHEVDVGTLRIDPPESMPTAPNDERLAPGADPVSPRAVTMQGLNFLFDYPDGVQVQFQARVRTPRPQTITEVVDRQLRWQEIDAFLLRAVEFIDKIGVDADFGDAEDIEWADLEEHRPSPIGSGGEAPDAEAD